MARLDELDQTHDVDRESPAMSQRKSAVRKKSHKVAKSRVRIQKPRIATAALSAGITSAHKGLVVRALEKAGIRISTVRTVKNLDALIRKTVADVAAADPAKDGKTGGKGVRRLVGGGIPKAAAGETLFPWASDADIEQTVDLADTLSSNEIATKLNTSRETINAWRKAGRILGVEGVRRGVRYPAAQIGPNLAPLPGIADIISAFDGDHWSAWRLLSSRINEMGGLTGFEVLRAKRKADLISLLHARSYGSFS
jgi:hypothetical protein